MRYEDLYDNICKSLTRLIKDFIDEVAIDATFYNFDGHAQISELPEGLVMGPAGVGMTDEGQELQVVFGFSIAVSSDPHLFRLRSLTSKLSARLRPMNKIDIYDGDTGEVAGWMIITPPVSTTPVTNAELRSVQSVVGHALVDLSLITSPR